ncbi:unnamed protein product [Tenebrio molitor]|nr:unnamed protein product [Tenebrio molitor]
MKCVLFLRKHTSLFPFTYGITTTRRGERRCGSSEEIFYLELQNAEPFHNLWTNRRYKISTESAESDLGEIHSEFCGGLQTFGSLLL